ncbi:MAG: PorP/SprF family type IX secretion system membrane protein [Saprospiraceae bacterium]
MLLLRPVLMLVFFAASVGSMLAQDIHFSQFGNAPLNLNPGLSGIFGGDLRFVGNFRSQWHSVRVPYTTYSGSVENKWYYKKGEYDRYFTGGLLLNVDKQGSLELTSLQIGIPLGITIPVAKNNFLSLGVTPAFGQRSFNSDEWSFDAQFVDCLYQPNAPTMEDGSLFSTNLKYFDLSTGLNYRFYAAKKRTRFDIGGAVFHVNRPNHDFWTNARDVRLAMRKTVYGIGLVQVSPILDILGHAMYQEQGGYREILYGAGARVMVSTQPYKELAIQAFFSFRHRYTDAGVARLEFFYRTWSLGLSYDVNFSDFAIATGHRGGPEVSLSYRLYKIKPVDRKCPID